MRHTEHHTVADSDTITRNVATIDLLELPFNLSQERSPLGRDHLLELGLLRSGSGHRDNDPARGGE